MSVDYRDGQAVEAPELSIVLASTGSSAVGDAVAGLCAACRGISAELIVVAAGVDPLPSAVDAGFPGTRVVYRPGGTLTPVLWGAGLGIARGRSVAFTTDQVRVPPAWAHVLLSALASGVAGVGGPIGLAPGADSATAAAYFVRFSAFSPGAWPAPAPARDVPGDNAGYDRETLLRHADLLESGFWEVEFHRRFEREGAMLQMNPGACATLVGPVPFGPMVRQRFRHASVFGAARVERHGEGRVRLLSMAPLVPFALMARMARRALPVAGTRGAFFKALPRVALLSAAWASGEALGALRARAPESD